MRCALKTWSWLAGVALTGLLFLPWTAHSQDPSEKEWLGPYVPTPLDVAEKMLDLGELKPGEVHYDLGSGDGRFVILAAQKFRAHSVGFEIGPELVTKSRERIRQLGLQSLARIEARDLMTADFSKADLLTVYLLPVATEKLTPVLEKQMRPGSRVVARYFAFKEWTPDKVIQVESGEGAPSAFNTLYLYRR